MKEVYSEYIFCSGMFAGKNQARSLGEHDAYNKIPKKSKDEFDSTLEKHEPHNKEEECYRAGFISGYSYEQYVAAYEMNNGNSQDADCNSHLANDNMDEHYGEDIIND